MGRIFLAWDAPNIDMTLTQLLGHKPGPGDRPDMRAVLRWLVDQRAPDDDIEAAVFVNVATQRPRAIQGWISFLQNIGYHVFAKPKAGDSDIDEAMVSYLRGAVGDGARVFVASNDARRFVEPIREIARSVAVTVLGFVETAGELAEAEGWEFVDLQDIPDVISAALHRTRLDTLPAEGGWFEARLTPMDAVASTGITSTSSPPDVEIDG
jgi:uncharacterized protein